MPIPHARVSRPRLADELSSRIVDAIRDGRFVRGSRLPSITDLARRFGVGAPTLREALKRLESIGLVEIRHGSGVYVTGHPDVVVVPNPLYAAPATRKHLLDLIDARASIEVETAGLAARNARPEHVARMRTLLEEAAGSLDDDEVLNRTNLAFHREISAASGNAVMAQLLDVLTTLFQAEQRLILDIYGSRAQDLAEHEAILEAISASDEGLARQRMRDHLAGVRERLFRWDPEAAATS